MQIDGVGFDVQAMGKLSEKDFIDLHMTNSAILHKRPDKEKREWLKRAFKLIKSKAG